MKILNLMMIVGLFMFASCSTNSVKIKLPDAMKGKLNITKFAVTKDSSIKDSSAISKIESTLKKALGNEKQGSVKVVMHLNIKEWTKAETGMMSKLIGSKARIVAIAKVKDMSGKLLTEYQVFAEEKMDGLMGGSVDFTNAEAKLLNHFSKIALADLY